MLACAKKTNRKGQSDLSSVIDTRGRARAGNKGRIVAEHSARVCWERADAGLPTPLRRGQLATWEPFQGGWPDTSPGQPRAFCGAGRVNKMWPPCLRACQGWQVARHSRGDAVRTGTGESRESEELQRHGRGQQERGAVLHRYSAPRHWPRYWVPQMVLGPLVQSMPAEPQRPPAARVVDEELWRFIERTQGRSPHAVPHCAALPPAPVPPL